MTQRQSSVIKFSSLFFLPPEVIDSKLGVNGWGDASSSPNIFATGTLMLSFQLLLHDTKLIFCHQVQFYFFLPPEVSDNKPDVHEGDEPQNNLVAFLNNFEILFVIEKLNKIDQKIGNFAPIFQRK